MIKCFCSQPGDIGITPYVIRMAVFAFRFSRRTASVKTLFPAYIGSNFLMTIRTQPALTFLAEWLMTITALFLVFSMALHKLARHDQGFNATRYRIILHSCDCNGHDGHTYQAPYQHDSACAPAQYMCTAYT